MLDFDIIIPGHYFCDLIFSGLKDFPALGSEIYGKDVGVVTGGGALNTALALRRLGVNIGWAGALGNDFFSRLVLESVTAEGLSTALVQHLDVPLRRVTVALSYPSDRAFVTYADTPPDLVSTTQAALSWAKCKHIHFPRLVIDPRMPEMMRGWKAEGIHISMDCQHREETLADPLVRETLGLLDVFMPNAIEAQRITQTDNLEVALDRLAAIVLCVVIKNGGDGALLRCTGEIFSQAALKLTPIDTTGAGDCFNAGFLAAWLQGLDWSACLQWGNICGGLSTQGFGSSQSPDLNQLQKHL